MGCADCLRNDIVGAIALVAFIVRQLRMDDPMLDFRIYKHPMFALSSVISIVLSVAMFSGMILTPLYVQTIRGISPFHSGILHASGCDCDGDHVANHRPVIR